jgi:uncharacterized protein (DUF934 family)
MKACRHIRQRPRAVFVAMTMQLMTHWTKRLLTMGIFCAASWATKTGSWLQRGKKFENNQLKPLLKACDDFLQLREPPSQEELSRIAKAAANKDRVERLRGWLESEDISDLDLIAPAFPVTGGQTYISEKADLLSERIRGQIGAPPDGYTESFSTDIYERVYLDYFQRESEKLRSYDIAQLDRKERFIKSQYFSSLTEVAAQLLKLSVRLLR